MNPDALSMVQHFVKSFIEIHQRDPLEACKTLLTAFITCFAMLSPADRMSTASTLFTMVADINVEGFEDGQDFVDFLKEKIEQRVKEYE